MGAALAWAAVAAALGGEPRCDDHVPTRQAFYGDLHVHTALSLDAATQETRTRPHQAYAFATGAPLEIQPFDDAGRGMRTLKLDRPLDFAAVTDHAELLGEVEVCSDPTSAAYDTWSCAVYRRFPRLAFFWMNRAASVRDALWLCGEDRALCRAGSRRPWDEIREAAAAYAGGDGACAFTAFVGYEWTGAKQGGNLHRNVIFATDDVPDLPISFYEAGDAWALYDQLEAQCVAPGCGFVVIPHNANLSNGFMFPDTGPNGEPLTAADAARRAQMEPLVEIVQHKGQSACWPGSADELCGFEPLPYATFPQKYTWGSPPGADAGWAREVLGRGLVHAEALGEDPFAFGFIGSTDTHLGAPGAVSEDAFPGHGGAGVPAAQGVPAGLTDEVEFNPGGLAGVWAEENSRESLFAALQRRETFATSGPRIAVRLFAGDLGDDPCGDPDRVEKAYVAGVPMGGELSRTAPRRFFVEATADPDGLGLARVQLVRGVLREGVVQESVVDLAAVDAGRADPSTCAPAPGGEARLCAAWTDADAGDAPAFYYARVLEAERCRWSQVQCVAAGVDCAGDVPDTFAACCDPDVPATIQERAWSSPVWFR